MEKNGVSFLDYFKETETLIFLDELNHLEENAKAVRGGISSRAAENRKEKGEIRYFPVTGCAHGRNCVKRLNRQKLYRPCLSGSERKSGLEDLQISLI